MYLAPAELVVISARPDRLPTMAEYRDAIRAIAPANGKVYRYLNFNKIEDYNAVAATVGI